jgi:deferrochelatase/peroxidase EfeB
VLGSDAAKDPILVPPAGYPGKIAPALNDFEFKDDQTGDGCPFHAHIRKMNPRLGGAPGHSADGVVASQPVRRGIPWDPEKRLEKAERQGGEWPTEGVGLLFMAYMRDLDVQFEKLHNSWATDPTFPTGRHTQNDPVLMRGNKTPWTYGGLSVPPAPMESFVRRLGGAYFYVPSIAWLERGGA